MNREYHTKFTKKPKSNKKAIMSSEIVAYVQELMTNPSCLLREEEDLIVYEDTFEFVLDSITVKVKLVINNKYCKINIFDRNLRMMCFNSCDISDLEYANYDLYDFRRYKLFDYDCKTKKDLTKDILIQFVDFVFNKFLPNLIFNKVDGTYITRNSKRLMIARQLLLKGKFDTSKEAVEECCVCHEETQIKTECNHILCHPCWKQIKPMKCPLCREAIHFVPCGENHEDEDDE